MKLVLPKPEPVKTVVLSIELTREELRTLREGIEANFPWDDTEVGDADFWNTFFNVLLDAENKL